MLRIHDHMANDALEGLFVTISWLHNKIKTLSRTSFKIKDFNLEAKKSIWSYNQLLNKTPTQKSRFVLVIQVREFKKRMKNHIQIYMSLNCTFTFIKAN